MFKAYFEVSLELVRDVVRSCEEEMMASFDDSADKPVSAVFNAPIPNDSGPSTSAGKPAMVMNNPGNTSTQGVDGRWPIMEAMSQDAIDEMVNNVFQCADTNKDGKISFEEFEAWAANDNTILAWFEALGTIFWLWWDIFAYSSLMTMVIQRMFRIFKKTWNSKLYSEFRLVRVNDKCKVATDNYNWPATQMSECNYCELSKYL